MKYINSDKLETFDINTSNTYIVMDFDKTITTGNSLDSWAVAGNLLNEDLKNDMEKLYEKYRPIEIDYTITVEEKRKAMIEWYESCMNLYPKYNLTQNKMIESVVKNIKDKKLVFRNGVEEFFIKAKTKNIPIIILSAGIGNVIKEALKQYNCYFNNIYIIGNFIEFDQSGNIKKFDNYKILHTLNKNMKEKLQKEEIEKTKNKKYKILIGDLKEDENMVDKNEWNSTIKIGILNDKMKNALEVYKNTFDVVLTDENACFQEIEKILN